MVGQGWDRVAGVGGRGISPTCEGAGKASWRKRRLNQVSEEEEKWVQWKEGSRVVRGTGREKSFPRRGKGIGSCRGVFRAKRGLPECRGGGRRDEAGS